jgi:uncharacterized protein
MEKPLIFTNKGQKLFGVMHYAEGSGKNPCVVMFHGFTGNKAEAHFLFTKMARAIAKAGVSVFRFDFRGSGDSEGDFSNMSTAEEVSDGIKAVAFVRKDKRIDPKRTGVIGLSMGGFVAASVLGAYPDLRCGVLLSAVCSFIKIKRNIRKSFRGKRIKGGKRDMGGLVISNKFFDDMERVDWKSLAGVNKYKGSLLVIHSKNDETVPISEGEMYYKSSPSRNKKMIVFKKGGHVFSDHVSEKRLILETNKWVKKALSER